MENNITIYQKPQTTIKPYRNDYIVNIGDKQFNLKRNEDFGMLQKKDGSYITNKPTLFKSGSHKILTAFGLTYINEVTDSYKDHSKGYFYYEVKTTAYFDGKEVRSGLGCANTNESANGNASGYNTANSMLKKAEKRSEVDLAIKLADASGWFTADLEDMGNDKRASQLMHDDDPITAKQVKRIFAIAGTNEITIEKAKELLTSWGYASTKDILQKDYDMVCEKLEKYGNGEQWQTTKIYLIGKGQMKKKSKNFAKEQATKVEFIVFTE